VDSRGRPVNYSTCRKALPRSKVIISLFGDPETGENSSFLVGPKCSVEIQGLLGNADSEGH